MGALGRAGTGARARGASRFTQKNARFFAGYAVDAHHVPLAWTPPGRVFAEIRLERSAILESGRVASAWGDWGDTLDGVERFRAARAGASPLANVPERIRDGPGSSGEGALAIGTGVGPVVLPVRWAIDGVRERTPRRLRKRSPSARRRAIRRSRCRSTCRRRGGAPGR